MFDVSVLLAVIPVVLFAKPVVSLLQLKNPATVLVRNVVHDTFHQVNSSAR